MSGRRGRQRTGDQGAGESALNSISEAFDHYRLPLTLAEPLAAAMPTMERQLLVHTLYILGATHDPQGRPLIEPFLNHPDPEVREEARFATTEITTIGPDRKSVV